MSAPDAEHLRALLHHLSAGLVERDEALRVALLAALAGQHVLLLGPPGTAKSLLARRLAGAFEGVRSFQHLLTRFTTPDELFGPVSIQALREHDLLRRRTEGYLPSAELVFLDEVFKASSAILNALLTLLNERVFFNGAEVEPAPLLSLIGASNELPAEEGLAALHDRFALRVFVGPVQTDEAFLRLIAADADPPPPPASLRLRPEGLAALREAARAVRPGPAAARVMLRLRAELADLARGDPQRHYVSDRRWREALRTLRVSAAAHGRDEVDLADCTLLTHLLWTRPEDLADVRRRVLAAVTAEVEPAPHAEAPAGAWRALLEGLTATPGVALPLRRGFELLTPHGGHALTDAEARALQANDPALLLRLGVLHDKARGGLVAVQRGPGGGLLTSLRAEATSPEQVREALASWAGRAGAFALAEGRVELREGYAPGCLLELGALTPGQRGAWLEALDALLDRTDEALAALDARLDPARARHHLFALPEDLAALDEGARRARLALVEQRAKALELRGAVEAGGRHVTLDVEAARP